MRHVGPGLLWTLAAIGALPVIYLLAFFPVEVAAAIVVLALVLSYRELRRRSRRALTSSNDQVAINSVADSGAGPDAGAGAVPEPAADAGRSPAQGSGAHGTGHVLGIIALFVLALLGVFMLLGYVLFWWTCTYQGC